MIRFRMGATVVHTSTGLPTCECDNIGRSKWQMKIRKDKTTMKKKRSLIYASSSNKYCPFLHCQRDYLPQICNDCWYFFIDIDNNLLSSYGKLRVIIEESTLINLQNIEHIIVIRKVSIILIIAQINSSCIIGRGNSNDNR